MAMKPANKANVVIQARLLDNVKEETKNLLVADDSVSDTARNRQR